MGKRIFFVLIAVLILSGFTGMPEIKDLRDISQDHRTFTERQTEEFSRLNPEVQNKSDIFYNERFFSPWHQETSRYTVDEVWWEFDKYGKDQGYGRNGKKHSRSWIRELIANAQLEHYSQKKFPAITLQNTDLRVLPTSDAHLSNPRNGAFPFDNMQNSGVAANTPIFVSHVAGDKKWVLAETHYAMGWMPARHIAPVDADFIKQWENAAFVAIIKDKTPISGEDGKVLFNAPVGSFFPKTGEDAKTMQILIATADKRGMAVTKEVVLSRETVAAKPLKLTADNMAKVANELMNTPYGWGGLDQRRDCSSTLMDMFAPFGIWLPRNSGHQATMTGALINLKNLSSEEKEGMILKRGIPYFTLIWLKGHIMLYIGERDGHPLVFHNFWSVKTMDMRGKTGKRIVGKAAITTLYPGRELRQDKSHAAPLSRILGMTLIWPPPVGHVILSPEKAESK